MCLLALLAGVIGGVGAWAFRMLIGLIHNALFLGQLSFVYDANQHTASSPWGAGIIFVPVVGGLAVAWLVKNFAPEAKGHGVPEVMDAIHYNQGFIRPRVALVKSIASAISIGSGSAVGREGPIIQIGSAFGSMLGQFVRMPTRQRITLIAAGSGAGIAATFNAPLGGVVFAMELLLVSCSAINILLVALATVTATHISHFLLGTMPSFYIQRLELPNFNLEHTWSLGLFALLGCIMGLISVVFIRGLYWAEDLFDALPGNYYTRHTLGTLLLGIMMYLMFQRFGHYYIEGVGYATIVDVLTDVLTHPWFLCLLFVLKVCATWLSLGSGASGGVFSPVLFLGATVGAAFGHVGLLLVPNLTIDVAAFAIAGMAGGIGGTTGAVLTGIVMITEMTRDYNIMLPLIISVTTAFAVRKTLMRDSIYTLKLTRRGHIVPEGLQAALLTSEKLADIMQPIRCIATSESTPTDDKIWLTHEQGQIASIHKVVEQLENTAVEHAPNNVAIFSPQTDLVEAIRSLQNKQIEIILISKFPDQNRASDIVGVVTADDIARHSSRWAEFI
ncbi:MAG: chloride channel protein [Gammaproteobacteria bacterium]|nr:chloride channel protein [Gammaproteobacteria bacterium]